LTFSFSRLGNVLTRDFGITTFIGIIKVRLDAFRQLWIGARKVHSSFGTFFVNKLELQGQSGTKDLKGSIRHVAGLSQDTAEGPYEISL
jgi:hypothetical protein